MTNEKQIDLIDRGRLLRDPYFREDRYPESPLLRMAIKEQPTVDAVEVVHGRWDIFDDGYGCELMCCSVCKAEFYDGDNDTVDCLHNYCPHCGADMRGRSDGE